MADDEVQKLRERHHDLSGIVQQHTVDLALRGQEIKTMQAEIAHLADTRVSHEELTGALGPIRGDTALNKQRIESVQELMKSDTAVIRRDVAAINGSIAWIARTIIGAVVLALLGLLWQVAK